MQFLRELNRLAFARVQNIKRRVCRCAEHTYFDPRRNMRQPGGYCWWRGRVPKLFDHCGGNEDFPKKLSKESVALNLNEIVQWRGIRDDDHP